MMKFEKLWWKEGLHIIVPTILAFSLSYFVISDLTSIGIFAPVEKEMDFQISDIYNAVEENKTIHLASSDVIVIGVDNHDREGVLQDIRMIASAEPAAIGLDIYFEVSEGNDSVLLETITHTTNLVGATGVKEVANSAFYERDPLSFYENDYNPLVGFINVDTDQSGKVIRTFHPFVRTSSGDTIKSFELVLASITQPERAAQLIARGNEMETIDFSSYVIPIVDADLLDIATVKDLIKDKVVLIGDIRNVEDMYLTPLHGFVPGVMVHAYAVQTILHGSYIDNIPAWINWLIAIVICIIFVLLLLIAKQKMSNVGNLLIRICQFVIMYVLVLCGCTFFSRIHTYFDFAPSILMLGLGAFAFDIWFALYGIIITISSRIKNHLHK